MKTTPRDIPIFDTITGFETHPEGGKISVGDFASAMRRDSNRKKIHRHTHPELFWFHSGTGAITDDLTRHAINTPCLVFVDTGHVHSWPEHDTLEGVGFSFTQEFVRCDSNAPGILFPPPASVVIPLDDSAAPIVGTLVESIRREWMTRRDKEYLCVIRNLFGALMTEARRAYRLITPPSTPESARMRLHREFLLLLESRVDASFSVAEAAKTLGVSRDHLSAVLRSVTGRSAGDLIRERLHLEARRLLVHTRMEAAEIAYRLGYEDPSYFGRVFAKIAGCSPGTFRDKEAEA